MRLVKRRLIGWKNIFYITPTAVIKQINLLEADLDVKLFERTHRGLTLTKAGTSLYNDAKYVIQYCKDSVIRAKNADDIWQNHNQIQIVDFDFYSVDVFNRCENSNDVLMAVKAWDNVYPR